MPDRPPGTERFFGPTAFAIGAFAAAQQAPPWILGARGCPLDAPENTLSGLRLALASGLDGFAYDVRACATGEPILMADARLERTTTGRGPVADAGLPELFHLDAGSWFGKRFVGEAVPLLDEALELSRDEPEGEPPLHWVELAHARVAHEAIDRIRERGRRLPVRVASRNRETCLELRDLGLQAIYVAHSADPDSFRFVRDERLAGFATTMAGWRDETGAREWPCERWARNVDAPEELLEACRLPWFGLTTREPARALSARALCALCPGIERYPLQVPHLPIEPGGISGAFSSSDESKGEWTGSWNLSCEVENPFDFEVHVKLGLRVRRGAFEVEGLPVEFPLGPGELCSTSFRLTGGSWSPGGDPVVMALYSFARTAGRPEGTLLLDAPLERIRAVHLDQVARRLRLLRERPDDPEATLSIRRAGRSLLVSLENPGGLDDPHVVVHFDGVVLRGGSGLRAVLPERVDPVRGLAFSCGIEGWREEGGERVLALRRWSGGLPQDADAGVPGRLLPLDEA